MASRAVARGCLLGFVCILLCGCQGSKAPAPSSPVTRRDVPPVPPHLEDEVQQSRQMIDVIAPTDRATLMFAKLMSESAKPDISESADLLVAEILSEENLARFKIFEIQEAVGKLVAAGLYDRASGEKVALLQERLRQKIKEFGIQNLENDGLFIVASSAAVGILAGAGTYGKIPGTLESIRDFLSRFTSRARERFAAGYARDGEWLANAMARTRLAGAGLWNRVTMTSDELAYNYLASFDLPRVQMAKVLDLERVRRADVMGFQFQRTALAGFRYALADQWGGRDLGMHRVLVFEISGVVPNSVKPAYLASNEVSSKIADSIVTKLATNTEARRVVYFFDPRDWTFTPIRTAYPAVKAMLAGATERIRPLFSEANWHMVAGTALTTSGLVAVAYYAGQSSGWASGQSLGGAVLEPKLFSGPANE